MHKHRDESALVGVVPRHRARSIEPLMSDIPTGCSVAEDVESPRARKSSPLRHWLSSAAALSLVASAVEWLKLTR